MFEFEIVYRLFMATHMRMMFTARDMRRWIELAVWYSSSRATTIWRIAWLTVAGRHRMLLGLMIALLVGMLIGSMTVLSWMVHTVGLLVMDISKVI